jgi:tripartite-type tricarboxylate transporter receptor subunit TctC
MKNRTLEICTSGSVRDEAGQPPHLLGRRQFLHLAAGAAALPAVSRIAKAQSYPSRPISILVPFPAGGPTDTIARMVAERMRPSLGQPIIIENVAGANGNIGVGRVARAAADGYTLVAGIWSTHVANGALYTLSYDVLTDFEPVVLLSSGGGILIVVKNATPAKDLKELVAWLKANPDKTSQGHPGIGSGAHLGGLLFQSITGTRFQQIPYRGSAPAMQDLLTGQIDMLFADATTSLPHVQANKIKAYAVTAKSRMAAAPNIPTVDEAGLPGLYIASWNALFAPKGTPKEIIDKLNGAVVAALSDANVRARLADLGHEIFPRDQQTPEALAALQKADIEKWWPIIKAANIKGE